MIVRFLMPVILVLLMFMVADKAVDIMIEYAYMKGRLYSLKECSDRFDEVIDRIPEDLSRAGHPGLRRRVISAGPGPERIRNENIGR